ncbi:hypothetical protein D3C83_334380 [compost metagenome]
MLFALPMSASVHETCALEDGLETVFAALEVELAHDVASEQIHFQIESRSG